MKAVATTAVLAVSFAAGSALAGGLTVSTVLGTPGFTGSYVASFLAHDDGSGEKLYATGSFTAAGVAGTGLLARWNGSSWESVGGGLVDQYSNVMAEFQGDLIVGGYFNSANGVAGTAKLARWDGSNWNSINAQAESFLSSIWDLQVYDDGTGEKLYIAGNYVTLNGQIGLDHIARWDGTTYEPVGGTIAGAVPLIVLDIHPADLGSGEKLFAVGRFLEIGGVPALNIGQWDGSAWSAVGGGLTRTSSITQVLHMTSWNDGSGEALYVGGRFNIAGGSAISQNIAKWDGTSWSSMGDGFNSDVQELVVYDDGTGEALYAMGNFVSNPAGTKTYSHLAKWNGSDWEAVSGTINANVFGGYVYDAGEGPALILSGSFATVDGESSNRVVSFLGSTTCTADWNGSGAADIFDILDYLADWNAMAPEANIDGNGTVDIFDILAFLDLWSMGCP